MKKKRLIFSSLFVLLAIINPLKAQKNQLYSETFEISKRMKLAPDLSLKIYNTNGNVEIAFWDKDYIECNSKTWAQGWEEEAVKKFVRLMSPQLQQDACRHEKFIKIAIDYKHYKHKCNCKDDDKGNYIYKKNFKRISVKDFKTDYKIFIPNYLKNLVVVNYYGDIVLPNYQGRLYLKLKQGLLMADTLQLTKTSQITLNQASANIKHINASRNVYLKFFYCKDININQLHCYNMNSKKSNLQFGQLKCDYLYSTTDSIYINESLGVKTKAAFSNIYIKKASNYLNINLEKSGHIDIKSYRNDFKSLTFKGLYSTATLNLNAHDFIVDVAIKNSLLQGKTFKLNHNTTNKIDTEQILGNKTAPKQAKINCEQCDIKL